ncbi:hypothetical protein FHR75_004374 [Kineococcus radiotolerans]|uniref:Uncharacterized protein n=1 Tax=Kineococcus radiotolerans TaxID=131568 RepID=A0A7W4TR80_KINRA|nr:hypothetical protein [Kineococcus radiotolerans]MBB2903532.1 hypothetical protein [Kineococcus radiotolerans]
MPTWVWMVVQNRDRAAASLKQADARGDREAAEFSRIWLAERQAVLERVGQRYDVELP